MAHNQAAIAEFNRIVIKESVKGLVGIFFILANLMLKGFSM